MIKRFLVLLLLLNLLRPSYGTERITKRLSPREYTDQLYYPKPIFDYEQINHGAFLLYFLGLLYVFFGIMQVHKLYLKPCLDLFRKTNTFDEDTMISTVEPIAFTATESFMSLYATFFGVSDVGISAFLGSNAFTACVERGVLILLAGVYGEIDWYVSLRDMITYSLVLLAAGLILSDNTIDIANSLLMLFIFFIYWAFMQFNTKIEAYLRKVAMLKKKFKIPPRYTDEQIAGIHSIDRREFEWLPEYYMETDTIAKDGFLEFGGDGMKVTEKIKEIQIKKPALTKFYATTNTILYGIVSNRLKSRMDRNVKVNNKHFEEENQFAKENEEEYKEDQKKAKDENKLSKKTIKEPKSKEQKSEIREEEEKESLIEAGNENLVKRDTGNSAIKEKVNIQKVDSVKIENEEEHQEGPSIQAQSITWPKNATFLQGLFWLILFPVNILLYITLPTPRIAKGKEPNYLPLIYTLYLLWAAGFAFLLTWWLVDLSVAFDLPFLVLPMFVLPAGLFLRDLPRWLEFRDKVQAFKQKLKEEKELEEANIELKKTKEFCIRGNLRARESKIEEETQKVRIIEQYSSPIFTFTVGTSLVWVIYTLIMENINFTSQVIFIQLLLLMSVIIIKIILNIIAWFNAPRWLFYANMILYVLYMAVVLTIEFIGETTQEKETAS